MNAPFLTQAAEGLPRRGFTNAEIARMVEIGVIDDDERFELIKGEVVPMAPEFSRHARARMQLTRVFMRSLGEEWFVASETSLFLAPDTELKPDLHVFSARMESEDVRGLDVILAVELSSTTQRKDLQHKAPLYAAHGVRELWVIDLEARSGLVFDSIANSAYAPGRPVGFEEELMPRLIAGVSLRIADLF